MTRIAATWVALKEKDLNGPSVPSAIAGLNIRMEVQETKLDELANRMDGLFRTWANWATGVNRSIGACETANQSLGKRLQEAVDRIERLITELRESALERSQLKEIVEGVANLVIPMIVQEAADVRQYISQLAAAVYIQWMPPPTRIPAGLGADKA